MCNFLKHKSSKSPDYYRMVKELTFSRNHPFYADWKDWQSVAHVYHCPNTYDLQSVINKGKWQLYNMNWYTKMENDFVFEIHELCAHYRRSLEDKLDFEFAFKHPLVMRNFHCECEDENINHTCFAYDFHIRAHLIALMWTYIDLKFCPRKMKKYYKRLERVILSLPLDRLKQFDPDFIMKPEEYNELGKHLLIQMYRRAYFDCLNMHDFVDKCEELKNQIPRQQSGVIQSPSAILNDELFVMMTRLVEKVDVNHLLERFYRIKEQGLFSFGVNHEHRVDDESLAKIKTLLDESRESFTSSMANSLVIAGKNLMSVFAIATTVVVLGKAAAGFAFKILLNVLQLLYGLIFGREIVPDLNRVKQQGGDSTLSVPFLPAMLIRGVIGAPNDIVKTLWKNPNIDLIMRRLSYFGDPKLDRGIDRITEWIVKVINMTQAWYYREILGVAVPQDIESESHIIIKWNEEVDEVLKQYYDGSFVWSETSWSVIYNLYARGLSFTRSRMYDRYKYDVFRVVNKLGNILEKFKQHQRDGQTIRNPPVTIYLSGGTGVGKSSITYPLAAEILKKIFEQEGQVTELRKIWKSLIYMRSAEQEFWDGYENQFVTVFDDFNQQADSASNPNLELFEIIRASNCFPYPLHMASLDQKATTTFTSKIIIVSSNLEKPKTQSLNFPEALTRRFDVCVKVGRKQGFEGRLSKFNPDIYTFMLYDMKTNKLIRSVDYKELIQMCTEEYFNRCSFVDSIDSYIDSVLKPAQEQGPANWNELLEDEKRLEDWAWDDFPDPIPPPDSDRNLNNLRDQRLAGSLRNLTLSNFNNITSPFSSMNPLPDPFENRNIFKRSYDWLRGRIPCLWDDVKQSVEKLRSRYDSLRQAWSSFKERHPYIAKAIMISSFIIGALMFLKMFISMSQLIWNDKKSSPKQELWRDATPRSVRSESYTLPVLKSNVKAEAYTQVMAKGAKTESYVPALPKSAKAEAIEYDPATGMPVSQGVKDINATEILSSLLRRNLYKMYESTQNAPIGHCVFLKGKIALMPRHFMYAFKQALRNDPDACIYFKSALLQRAYEVKVSELLDEIKMIDSPTEEFEPPITRDLMAVLVSSSIIHPDISTLFSTRESLSRVDSTELVLPVMVNNNFKGSDVRTLIFRYRKGKSILSRVVTLPVGNDEKDVLRYVRDAWKYEMDTQATECGAPLIVRNNQISPGKICGLHIAGLDGTGEGFATPVYADDISRILRMFPEKAIMGQRIREKLEEFPKEQGQIPEEAEFIREGSLQQTLHQPSSSQIRPSLCYAKIKEPETKPCQLRPNDKFDPRGYRLGRLGNIPQAISRDIVENAGRAFLDECSEVISTSIIDRTVLKAVYSFEEAVKGIDGEFYVNSIKRNTSPGYPFITKVSTSTRKMFFGEDMEYDLASPQCRELKFRVDEIIESAKRNEVLDHYFIDTLKDERKPIHKAHKTRLFSAGPLDYLVVCKMYFNGVVALLQKNRNWSHVSVGTNPYSEDWGEIVRSLHRKSKLMVAGDFEGFDASQLQKLLEEAGEVFVQLSVRHLGATDEDVRVMRVLLVSLINSFHITGKEVYQWTHSLPSGHYLTAPINSVFVNIVFGCIWQLAFEDVSYLQARSFWKECGIVAYGDDHIVSIPQNRIDIFNQLTIPILFQKIGLSYTMEDKDVVATRPYRRIEEVSYLKRGFYRDEDGKWLAPLSLGTVLETPMWIRKCPDPTVQTIDNLEWAVKELSLHEEKVWQHWFPILDRELRELGHYTMLCRQMEVREMVKSDGCDLLF